MPVHGLWDLLRSRDLLQCVSGSADVRAMLEGKRIAVDLGIWAVEGQTRSSQLCAHGSYVWNNFFILVCFWRTLRFLGLGSLPVGVMDGASPELKACQRRAGGQHEQHMKRIRRLFELLGCPAVQASGEAEGLCCALSMHGIVDAVCSSDSDVLPFGATGAIFKMVDIGGADSAWHLEVGDSRKIHSALGFARQGLICLACLSGCDWISGWPGVGAQTALKMVKGLLRHTPEDGLRSTLVAFLKDFPSDLRKLAELNRCQTCRRCGHGSPRQRHGKKGCGCCGTDRSGNGLGGCNLRVGPCSCDFHARHDEVILARTLVNADQSITPQAIRAAWDIYTEPAPTWINSTSFVWNRPNVAGVSDFLQKACGYPIRSAVRNLLPVLLLWDLTHPEDAESQFIPTAVVGECCAGLSDTAKKSDEVRSLVVLDWGVRDGVRVDGDAMDALRSIPRPRRSVPKSLAIKHCPALVVKFLIATLRKKSQAADLPRKQRNRAHWQTEAYKVFTKFGFDKIPSEVDVELNQWETTWRQQAMDCCIKQIAHCRDPWARSRRIADSFGVAFDAEFKSVLAATGPATRKQKTINDFFLARDQNNIIVTPEAEVAPPTPPPCEDATPCTPRKSRASSEALDMSAVSPTSKTSLKVKRWRSGSLHSEQESVVKVRRREK